MKNPDQPRTWESRPAERFTWCHFLSPIEVGENGQIFFATEVEPIEGPNYIIVRHPIADIGRGLRLIDGYERNGRLPW